MGLGWVNWVFINYELGLGWLARFEKLKVPFSWVSWVFKNDELSFAGFGKIKVGFSWIFWISNHYN